MRNRGVGFPAVYLRLDSLSWLMVLRRKNSLCSKVFVRAIHFPLFFLFDIAIEARNVMMVESIEKGLFKGIKVGNNNVEISNLQFADDALFIGSWLTTNTRNLLQLLSCFGDASGLQINRTKRKLYGVGVFEAKIIRLASKCRCSSGSIYAFHVSRITGGSEYEAYEKLGAHGGKIQEET